MVLFLPGTRPVYKFIREELGVQFNRGQHELDTDMEKIFAAVQDERIVRLLLKVNSCSDNNNTSTSVNSG